MLNWIKKSRGILGMNSRNLNFIKPGNPRSSIALVDSKLRTKLRLKKNGLSVCRVIGKIRDRKELYTFDWKNLPNSFVLKPNRGLGGEGIMVTFGRKKNGKWVLPLDKEATLEDVMLRASNILDGDFSITNAPDIAFFEERLKIHPCFKLYAYKGVPDIRVIVFNRVPIMAMLRMPTKSSEGRANLHKRGLGLGIDISTGVTTYAIQDDKMIENLPGIRLPLRGIKIPFWDDILELAINAAIACKLNYTGVDIAIDREKGPVILELNARPGLSIQIANMAPLAERLLRVKGLKIKTAKKGMKVAKELFGGEIEDEVEEITGKKVLGIITKVKLEGKNQQKIELEAKIDTGAGITAIDEEVARSLGFGEALDYYNSFDIKNILTREEVEDLQKRKVSHELVKHPDIVKVARVYSSHGVSYRIEVPIKIEIEGMVINSNASVISRAHMQYPIIIGRRDLKPFLIDPNKK